ncbi:MAG: RNA 2'-phosphotransferase [Calditrichota bacterium]
MKDKDKKISKFLSLILRHRPQVVGIELGNNGWVETDKLLKTIQKSGRNINLEDIKRVVATNDKQRFAFSEGGGLIRANQGHSVKIELNYDAVKPPVLLYHGTAEKFIKGIRREGLRKMRRHHVHLSSSVETASKVGVRHGKLVLLKIDSAAMHRKGMVFYCSENGVWLTEHVPPDYIHELKE